MLVHQQSQLALSVTAARFWEALRLEPYAGKKTLIPVIVCPAGETVEQAARQAIREISAVYEVIMNDIIEMIRSSSDIHLDLPLGNM
jgi:hypothetical protein